MSVETANNEPLSQVSLGKHVAAQKGSTRTAGRSALPTATWSSLVVKGAQV